MEKVINVKSLNSYHIGASDKLKEFIGCYFEEKNDVEMFLILKKPHHIAKIHSIEYKPDEIYYNTDGYAGNCWLATMHKMDLDGVKLSSYKLSFRNFVDLIAYYENQKMKFVYNDDSINIYNKTT